MTRWLPDIWYCNSVFNSHDIDMLITWPWYVYTWHDPSHLISDTGTWHVITWHLISDTWWLICYHLILDICYHLVLTHLTWYCDTWLYTITPDTCTTLHIHDYNFYMDLDMIIILLPDIWYSWTLALLNSYIPCTHVPCTVTLVNSMVKLVSDRACLVTGWRGCMPRSC